MKDNNVEIVFYESNAVTVNRKATIHITGKLGFSQEAIIFLDLESNKYLRIGYNKQNSDDKSLYVTLSKEESEGSFKIINAGKYMYVNTTALFDDLEYDYKNNIISYFISSMEKDGIKFFKFLRKEKSRTNKKIIE